MKLRIGLVNPNDPGSYRASKFFTENLGLCYLWSYLEKKGYEVFLCDARFDGLSPEEATERLRSLSLDLLGFSIWTREGAEWCSLFLENFLDKKNQPYIVLGGYFPTLQPETSFEILPQTHAIVMGEGEEILYNLIKSFEEKSEWKSFHGIAYKDYDTNNVIINARATLLEDLDILPWPQRYLTSEMGEDDEVFLEGSRGCVFCCSFCAIRPFAGIGAGSAWRYRSARSIVDEIGHLKKQNPVLNTFRFIDSDFIGPAGHGRAEEFAELVKKELPGIRFHAEGRAVSISRSRELLKKLKEAGLYRVYMGVESGSQKILNKMNKQTTVQENKDAIQVLKDLDIDCTYGFIMFTPWTTEEDIEENVEFLKDIGNIQMNKFFKELLLIPNTAAYKMAKKEFPITLKEDDRTYYTYPSLSLPVERIRKVGVIFEKKCYDFMEKIWFSYRGIRNAVKQGLPEAKIFDTQSNKLCLDIFNFCWEKSRYHPDIPEQKIVDSCIEKFSPDILKLLKTLSDKNLIKISSFASDIHY